jgi:Fe-S cluster biogenesis protein NfuA
MNVKINQKLVIEYEDTPNPNSLKFYPIGYCVSQNKTIEFSRNSKYINSSLALDLLEMEEIESVFYGYDFISISKKPELNISWDDLRAKIIFIILAHEKEIVSNNIFNYNEDSSESELETDDDFIEYDECDKETVDEILSILDEEIRPKIALDGGDIKLKAFKDGIAYLQLRGACSSCPSSSSTLYDYVREFLISMVDKLIDIERI